MVDQGGLKALAAQGPVSVLTGMDHRLILILANLFKDLLLHLLTRRVSKTPVFIRFFSFR